MLKVPFSLQRVMVIHDQISLGPAKQRAPTFSLRMSPQRTSLARVGALLVEKYPNALTRARRVGYVIRMHYHGDPDDHSSYQPGFILDLAARERWEELQVVLETGRSLTGLNEGGGTPGKTPMHMAIEAGREEIVSLLLRRGASPSSSDGWRCSVLHYACGGGAKPVKNSIIRLLLRAGADPLSLDRHGATPVDWARSSPSPQEEKEEALRLLMAEIEHRRQMKIQAGALVDRAPENQDESAPVPCRWTRLSTAGERFRQQGASYVLLPDLEGGTVLAYGGERCSLLASFSLQNHTWKHLEYSGDLPGDRSDHALCSLPGEASLLLHGGNGAGSYGTSHDARVLFLLDVQLARWEQLEAIESEETPSSAQGHTVALLPDRRFAAFLGDRVLCFSLVSMRWTRLDRETDPGRPERFCLRAAAVGERIYVFEGDSRLFAFHTEDGLWRLVETTGEHPPAGHLLAGPEGSLLLLAERQIFRLDLRTLRWSRLSPRGTAPPEFWYGRPIVWGERVLFFGLKAQDSPLELVYQLDFSPANV